MTKSGFEDLLLRFSRGECTKEENLKICAWFERIKLKPHFALTAKEKSLLEVKMLLKIDDKIDTIQQPENKTVFFTGLLSTYMIYGSIAASLSIATFLTKNHKTMGSNIQNERPLVSGQSPKKTFVYNETPLSTIVYELGHSHGMQIIMLSEKIKSCSFTGDLSNMTLLQKFDTICESVGANYQVNGSNIILSGQGCR
ncbi:FecR domain-containing protein [Dyadobacter sp. 3J3]|uniref:FecR domain-containing protein n=1 Tax=Dyadobacter sp. 3J3 TaxID=2606600 RepID=UPI00135A74C1|nr:DUF4974 domain-containing protein [Dyadobacter sp. 3J3]